LTTAEWRCAGSRAFQPRVRRPNIKSISPRSTQRGAEECSCHGGYVATAPAISATPAVQPRATCRQRRGWRKRDTNLTEQSVLTAEYAEDAGSDARGQRVSALVVPLRAPPCPSAVKFGHRPNESTRNERHFTSEYAVDASECAVQGRKVATAPAISATSAVQPRATSRERPGWE
jgi:hypothetical protein